MSMPQRSVREGPLPLLRPPLWVAAQQRDDVSMPLTLPDELDAAFDAVPSARDHWIAMPIETQSDLVAFIKDGWLRRTRRQRSATVARLCAEGFDSVLAWQALCAGVGEAGSATRGSGHAR